MNRVLLFILLTFLTCDYCRGQKQVNERKDSVIERNVGKSNKPRASDAERTIDQKNELFRNKTDLISGKIAWELIIEIIILVGVLYTVFLLLRLKKQNKKKKMRPEIYFERHPEDWPGFSKYFENQIYKDVEDEIHLSIETQYRVKIEGLNRQINLLERRINEYEEGKQNSVEVRGSDALDASFKNSQNPRNLYFSAPTEDGYFNHNNGSVKYKEGDSLYKIVISNEDNSNADFELCTQYDALQRALNDPNYNIIVACDPVNAYNPDAVKILTEQMGRVRLEDGIWRLVTKAKIRYI